MLSLAGDRLTTILFHRFFFPGEAAQASRDRLKRQCEWMRSNFTPLGLRSALDGLQSGTLPKRPILITIDDAKVEIMRVADIFADFGLPISIFACVGWCAKETPDEAGLLARVVNRIEWYDGPAMTIESAWGPLALAADRAQRKSLVDLVLDHAEGRRAELETLLERLDEAAPPDRTRITCSWAGLAQLMQGGVEIGGHSVSHVNLAKSSRRRMEFEIAETRRLLALKLGKCDVFAYPYGMEGTCSPETTELLQQNGFRFAFLTHSDFANTRTDQMYLPRIALPDRPMSHAEFCLRAAGAGVVYRKLKRMRN